MKTKTNIKAGISGVRKRLNRNQPLVGSGLSTRTHLKAGIGSIRK